MVDTKNSADLLVSVHMITYNHEQYITKAIEGVLKQKVSFNIELIIGEDCSHDSTRNICEQYATRFPALIKLLPSVKNLGMNRNGFRTLKACDGKYIAFCEGDDYWHNPLKLQKQISFLEDHPEYGMIHSNANHFHLKDNSLEESVYKFQPDFDDGNAYFDILTEKRPIATITVCVRRDLLFQVLDNCPECSNQNYLMGDNIMWLEISRLTKIKYLNDSLATYNVLLESASHGLDPNKQLRFQLSAKEIYYHYLSKYECPANVAIQTKYSRIVKVLNSAILAKNLNVAQSELSELRKMNLEPPWTWRDRILFWGCRSRINSYFVEILRNIWALGK